MYLQLYIFFFFLDRAKEEYITVVLRRALEVIILIAHYSVFLFRVNNASYVKGVVSIRLSQF